MKAPNQAAAAGVVNSVEYVGPVKQLSIPITVPSVSFPIQCTVFIRIGK